MDPLTVVNTRQTSQAERATPEQVPNSAGGFTFQVDDTMRLRRFLVLGVDGGTYYINAGDFTRDNAGVVLEWARHRCAELVSEIVSISTGGRAPKQNPALFALAAACSLGDDDGRRAALDALPLVARTGTHLFIFARYVEQFRGWGRGLRTAVGRWYTSKTVEDLAYQAVKYRQREGWSHRDLLRLAHPDTADQARKRLFDWVCGRAVPLEGLRVVEGFQKAQGVPAKDVPALVAEYPLSWEMLPDEALTLPATWEALLDKGLPQTALIRQLPRLTRLGLLTGARGKAVAAQLCDAQRLRKGRVHPMSVLVAQRTYACGQGARGQQSWRPVRQVVDALDAAFYAAFEAVEPSNKRLMLALDVSGSMTAPISGLPLSCREASAALALVTAATEPDYEIVGFTAGADSQLDWRSSAALTPLPISPRQRLDDVLVAISSLPFGGTDCALPMLHALERNLAVDTFVVYTDNETWAGSMHPHEALRRYRQRTGINARLVVVGMTATRLTIADPGDPLMLDVAGFDTAVPILVTDFARGL